MGHVGNFVPLASKQLSAGWFLQGVALSHQNVGSCSNRNLLYRSFCVYKAVWDIILSVFIQLSSWRPSGNCIVTYCNAAHGLYCVAFSIRSGIACCQEKSIDFKSCDGVWAVCDFCGSVAMPVELKGINPYLWPNNVICTFKDIHAVITALPSELLKSIDFYRQHAILDLIESAIQYKPWAAFAVCNYAIARGQFNSITLNWSIWLINNFDHEFQRLFHTINHYINDQFNQTCTRGFKISILISRSLQWYSYVSYVYLLFSELLISTFDPDISNSEPP